MPNDIPIHRNCMKCGKPFTRMGPRVPPDELYFCSEACKKNLNVIDVVCDYCGKTFQRKHNAYNKGSFHHYCSRECHSKDAIGKPKGIKKYE